ncbi:hypothetical protein H5V45_05800 [Nocardioides sp. KIGAM211]|uniref:GlsB/YeaQ/YmgE family stress response membrane protein n=1 Tax=Nocardioides luti TaxID=2761101 RepID=A0A7X0REP4_9ACTN|nr:hypothetical protein [Nocardioides luti]MBB6626830.1 hypothetical protein [Nocardioides luti]
MLAFLVAGVIVGVLARVLRHGPDAPSLLTTLAVGMVGAAIGGAGINLLISDPVTDLNRWAFTGACLVPMVLLGLVEGRAGRA